MNVPTSPFTDTRVPRVIVLFLAGVCVPDEGSITLYRHYVYTYVILFLQISPTSKISRVFLHVAAAIADSRDMTKQPIMIRVVVVCPVTGVYSVRWVPILGSMAERLAAG